MNAFLHKTLAEVYAHADNAEPHERAARRDRLTPRAKKAAAALDFRTALPLYRAAYFFQPYREEAVFNLAEVLYDYALAIVADKSVADLPRERQKQVWRLLCESLAGAELSTYIQNKPLTHIFARNGASPAYIASTGLAIAAAAALDRFFPGRCHSTGNCDAYKRGKKRCNWSTKRHHPRRSIWTLQTCCASTKIVSG